MHAARALIAPGSPPPLAGAVSMETIARNVCAIKGESLDQCSYPQFWVFSVSRGEWRCASPAAHIYKRFLHCPPPCAGHLLGCPAVSLPAAQHGQRDLGLHSGRCYVSAAVRNGHVAPQPVVPLPLPLPLPPCIAPHYTLLRSFSYSFITLGLEIGKVAQGNAHGTVSGKPGSGDNPALSKVWWGAL